MTDFDLDGKEGPSKKELFNGANPSENEHKVNNMTKNQNETKTDQKKTVDKNESMKNVSDMYERWKERKENGPLGEKAMDIVGQWQEVERMYMFLFDNHDLSSLTESEKDKVEEKIDKKIDLYNVVQKYTFNLVDPYKIEVKQKIKQSQVMYSGLEKSLKGFEIELNGRTTRLTNTSFYKDLLQSLPESMREHSELGLLVDKLQMYAGDNRKGKGLKAEERDLESDLIFLDNFYQGIESVMTQISENIDTTKAEIRSINSLLEDEPGNNELLGKRAELSGMLNSFKDDLFKYTVAHEQTFEELDEKTSDYEIISEDVQALSSMVDATKESLKDLKSGIKRMDRYVNGKSKVVAYSGHIVMVKRAATRGLKLKGAGYMAQTLMAKQLKGIADTGYTGHDMSTSTNEAYKEVKTAFENNKKERVDRVMTKVRQNMYN